VMAQISVSPKRTVSSIRCIFMDLSLMVNIPLAPGERAEILLDLREDSGKFLRLQSYSAEITPTI
jgi:hypothetical protein